MEEKVAPKIYTCKPNSNTTGKTTGSNRHLTILATKKRCLTMTPFVIAPHHTTSVIMLVCLHR